MVVILTDLLKFDRYPYQQLRAIIMLRVLQFVEVLSNFRTEVKDTETVFTLNIEISLLCKYQILSHCSLLLILRFNTYIPLENKNNTLNEILISS